MADYLTTDTELTAIADAIRTKGGTSASLTYPNGFVSAINAIPTGGGGGLTAKTITGYGTASVTPTGWNITDLQTNWETPKVLGLVASDSLTSSPLTYYVDAPGNGEIYCLGSITAPFDTIYEWIYLRFTYSRNIQTGAITSISLQEAGYYADNQLVEDMTEYIEDWTFTSIS